jgi:hypothetical protein
MLSAATGLLVVLCCDVSSKLTPLFQRSHQEKSQGMHVCLMLSVSCRVSSRLLRLLVFIPTSQSPVYYSNRSISYIKVREYALALQVVIVQSLKQNQLRTNDCIHTHYGKNGHTIDHNFLKAAHSWRHSATTKLTRVFSALGCGEMFGSGSFVCQGDDCGQSVDAFSIVC